MSKIIDLSHRIHTDMPIYPGDRPLPKIATIEKNSIAISSIRLGSHMGTHMDAPRHFISAGKSLGEISPDRFIGKAVCLDKTGEKAEIDLSKSELDLLETLHPDWLLIFTGHDRMWNKERYFTKHPFPSVSMIGDLLKLNISGLGVDFPSIDAAGAQEDNYPVHRQWLGADRLAIENLKSLDQLPTGKTVDFYALPLNIDVDGAPVRVLVRLDG